MCFFSPEKSSSLNSLKGFDWIRLTTGCLPSLLRGFAPRRVVTFAYWGLISVPFGGPKRRETFTAETTKTCSPHWMDEGAETGWRSLLSCSFLNKKKQVKILKINTDIDHTKNAIASNSMQSSTLVSYSCAWIELLFFSCFACFV